MIDVWVVLRPWLCTAPWARAAFPFTPPGPAVFLASSLSLSVCPSTIGPARLVSPSFPFVSWSTTATPSLAPFASCHLVSTYDSLLHVGLGCVYAVSSSV